MKAIDALAAAPAPWFPYIRRARRLMLPSIWASKTYSPSAANTVRYLA